MSRDEALIGTALVVALPFLAGVGATLWLVGRVLDFMESEDETVGYVTYDPD